MDHLKMFVVVILITSMMMVNVGTNAIPSNQQDFKEQNFLTKLQRIVDDKFNFILQFILPQIPDIYSIDGPIFFNWPGIISMEGSGTNVFVNGIPSTKAKLSVNPMDSTITFSLSNDLVKLTGEKYDIVGIGQISGTRFNGSGKILAEAQQLEFAISTKLIINSKNEKLSISKTDMDLQFGSFYIEVANLELDFVKVDWELINQMIKEDFNKEWLNIKIEILKNLEKEVNAALEDLTLEDILHVLET